MEELKNEETEKAAEKKRILEERVPPLDLDGLSQGGKYIYPIMLCQCESLGNPSQRPMEF